MFTGIIEATGKVESLTFSGKAAKLVIGAEKFWDDVKVGESVAVDGVCLTAETVNGNSCSFDVSKETLDRSILGGYKTSSVVNMEKAMRPTDRLGGHFVQGHVDGVGKYLSQKRVGDNIEMEFEAPQNLDRYVVEKGSISINGISLTAFGIFEGKMTIALIPHTLEVTNLCELKPGDPVNIECDIIAKHVEKLLKCKDNKGIDLDFLAKKGFK